MTLEYIELEDQFIELQGAVSFLLLMKKGCVYSYDAN